jgi:hypothetical protein
MTEDQMQAIVDEFRKAWPNAEFGPAHIVIADGNFEAGHLSWCDGIIYAVQEERRQGGKTLYADHSDNELEATHRLLTLLANWSSADALRVRDNSSSLGTSSQRSTTTSCSVK